MIESPFALKQGTNFVHSLIFTMNPKRPLSSSSYNSKRRKRSPPRKCAGAECTARGTQVVKYAHDDLYYCETCKPMDAINTHLCGLLVVMCTACRKDIAVDVFEKHRGKCPGADMGPRRVCAYEDPAGIMARLDQHRHTHTGTLPFPCTECGYAATNKHHLDEHMVQRHHAPGKYSCPRDGCTFQTNHHGKFTNHMHAHDGIRPHPCPEANCTRAFTHKHALHRHLRNVHGNGVRFFQCGIDNCRYKAGTRGHLARHQRDLHDVGELTCALCCRDNRGKIVTYTDTSQGGIGVKITACLHCMWASKTRKTRRERLWAQYVIAHSTIGPYLTTDVSLLSLGGCSTKRPDLFATSPLFTFIGEFDEYQHLRGADYTCDRKRIYDLCADPSIVGRPAIVLRMNPDRVVKLTTKERTRAYVALLEKLIASPPTAGIHVHYMYYGLDNPNLPPEGKMEDGSGMTIYYHDCQ
jgi:ribosomal protein L44E